MLQISKQGNSIVVEGLNHYFYPYNGTLEVPCNSVICVTDEGDIVLFRSASNYDVLFSAKIDEITINGQSVTKDNVGEVFGALSNVSSGGGGLTPEQEEKLNNAVQISDYNADKASQTTIDEAQNTEINKLKGDIADKQDIIQDLNAIREGAAKGATAIQEETDPTVPQHVKDITEENIAKWNEGGKTGEVVGNNEAPKDNVGIGIFTGEGGEIHDGDPINTGDLFYMRPLVVGEVARVGKAGANIYFDYIDNDSPYYQVGQNKNWTVYNTDMEVIPTIEITKGSALYARWNGTSGTLFNVNIFTKAGEDKSGVYVYEGTEEPSKVATEKTLEGFVDVETYNKHITDQAATDEAQNTEINKLKGDIAGKQDIIQDLNAIREGADLGKTALQEETDPVWTAEKSNYYTKSEVDTSLEAKADKTEIPTVPTNVSAFTNDAGYLTEHQSLDNYYTKTESDGKYATQVVVNEEIEARIREIRDVKDAIKTKADKTEIPTVPTNVSAFTNDAGYLTEHQSLSNYYTKSEVDTSLETKANKSEIPNLNGYATEQWVGQQGYLTEHQPLKTINGETIVGNGNIEISSGEETDPVWTAEKGNYYTKSQVDTSLESKANKSEIPTVPTNVSAFTNDAGYLTEHQPLKTINGETIVGSGDIVISGGSEETDPIWTAEKVNYYTKTESDGKYATQVAMNEEIVARKADIREVNTSLETKANKSEIPTVPTNVSAFTNDAGYLTEHQSLDNYYTKSEVNTSLETKANKSEIPSLNGYATEQWVEDKGYITEETDPTVPSHVKAITEEDIAKWNRGGRDVYKWSFYPYSYATEKVSFTFTKNGDTITGSQGYILKYKRHSKTGEIDGTYQTASTNSFLFNIPLTDDTIFIIAFLEKDSSTYLEFSFDVVSNIKGGGITEETDPVWTAEKGNYYTKSEIDGIVGNVNNALSEIING